MWYERPRFGLKATSRTGSRTLLMTSTLNHFLTSNHTTFWLTLLTCIRISLTCSESTVNVRVNLCIPDCCNCFYEYLRAVTNSWSASPAADKELKYPYYIFRSVATRIWGVSMHNGVRECPINFKLTVTYRCWTLYKNDSAKILCISNLTTVMHLLLPTLTLYNNNNYNNNNNNNIVTYCIDAVWI